ncbi:OprD family outer membrane porin [Flavobacterium sp. CHNK8]|uniref:OprD family outer membrane porin n=1 Tax=Flavobacterium sp. CHNK8 TaxID=2871165 RepID=UPI001C8E6E0D|nr:OprD family outer membrane porin [Flavobacterium sp. CHNK8]QZK90649.1 OprD family outer membrane porin [Flavobacterium sp. CHNK8]
MKKFFVLIYILTTLFFSINTIAQHQEISEKPTVWKEKNNEKVDSTSILNAFKNGNFNGHFRYFFMSTNNESGLSDYYANALGGGVKFETAKFHNFQFGVSGYYIFNIGSSDFSKKDPVTNLSNRYEVALFDIQNPSSKDNLSRLEELYLKYNFKNSNITLGKQLLNTSFINLQDGRMRPTVVDGIWIDFNELKKTKINLGYLYGISPRSTMKYFDVGESIGIYPSGINPDGTKSNYAGNLNTSGIYIVGLQNESIKNLKILLWNQYAEDIFNSALFQMDYKYDLNPNSKLLFGFQSIYQNALNFGGNEDQSKTYFEKNGTSQTFGGRLGWQNKKIEFTLNYNRITAKGRYLMPREWGRDPFYTFMARERNEGFGDVHALMTKIQYSNPKKRFKSQLAIGYFDLPDVKNVALNKYGLPSYVQTNVDFRYQFQGMLKGFDAQLLYVHKFNEVETYGNKNFIFNKTNMSNINLIVNFNF